MSIVQLPSSTPIRLQTPPVVASDLARITVEQYLQMIADGSLGPDDKIELIDGILVQKMSKNPEHVVYTDILRDAITSHLPAGWCTRGEGPVRLDTSVPEPDVAVVRGKRTDYRARHPNPDDIALVIEVAESSISRDRNWKRVVYARNSIAVYWIVNLNDRTLEVYANPTGQCEVPDYRLSKVLTRTDLVEILVAGTVVATIPVADLFPEAA